MIIPLTWLKVKSRATEVKSGSRINKPNKHISSFKLIKSMKDKNHTNSIFTQCHLSPQTHTHIQGSISFSLPLDVQRDQSSGSKLHRTPKTLAVNLSADNPAFQLKIQPKTALVSHQRIRYRTLNNGYYSDTGFRPLSLMIFRSLTQN